MELGGKLLGGSLENSVSGLLILDLPPKRAEAEASSENGPTSIPKRKARFRAKTRRRASDREQARKPTKYAYF